MAMQILTYSTQCQLVICILGPDRAKKSWVSAQAMTDAAFRDYFKHWRGYHELYIIDGVEDDCFFAF